MNGSTIFLSEGGGGGGGGLGFVGGGGGAKFKSPFWGNRVILMHKTIYYWPDRRLDICFQKNVSLPLPIVK